MARPENTRASHINERLMAPAAETLPMDNEGRESEHQRGKATWMLDKLEYTSNIR
jgi:hypothetical protein